MNLSFMAKIGADFLLSVFAFILLKIYLEIFFKYSGKKIPLALSGGAFFVWQFLVTGLYTPPAMLNIIINIFLSILISITAFEGNLLRKIIFNISYHVIWMLMEASCSYLLTLLYIDHSVAILIGAAMSQLALFLIIAAMKRLFLANRMRELSNNYTAMLLLVPLGSIYVVNDTFHLSYNIGTMSEKVKSLVALFFMLGINIIIFFIYIKLAEELELRRCMTAYKQQLELCERHQKERELTMLQVRNLRHNMKNNLITIMTYARQSDYSKIEEFIEELLQQVSAKKSEVANSGNIIVDSLINYRYAQAKLKDITFTVEMKIPMQLPFKGADLCLILGNALENAEEAASKMPDGKGFIHIRLTFDRGNLLILVKNSHNENVIKEKNGLLKTVKEDSVNHGIGLHSIKKTVEKYNGTVMINSQKEIFELKILLYSLAESFT